MDLSNFDTTKNAEGVDMPLVNPVNGQPFDGVSIRLVSVDSSDFSAARHRLANGKLKKMVPGKKLNLSSEELESQAIDLLVIATKGWTGVELDGKPLPFNAENARTVYTRFKWIRDQADEFINDRSNFLGN